MDERCEHGVPLGKDNPNLPCSRCQKGTARPGIPKDGSLELVRAPAISARVQ
jgi:hypothetical protein